MGANFMFLHGGGQGGWVWDRLINALRLQSGEDGGALRALDVPGCGTKRGRDTSALDFDGIVAELLADIEATGLRDIVLVGHSQAGTVMPKLAAARPGLFRRLVYVSCSSPLPGVTVPEMIGKGVQGQHADQVGWPVDPATSTRDERYRPMFCNDMDEGETVALLARLDGDVWPTSSYLARDWSYDHLATVPTSYVILLQDQALPAAWQERFAERFHADRVIRIDAGHQGMMTRPHALAEVLIAEARD
ncbi:alpha/beta hydrolase [Sphingobium sufflavum]|uniref:alpha/beta fold hydrolase n=1 Tax=Sphingobium sufflavum TaxID=1129547 RepID=UPI001F399D46|nr:alpha/beta fold hydrolase [Sphingobium sufflavum]MCE7796840.1 alpha/beta hydrolase [Sphingobium sufflavum]